MSLIRWVRGHPLLLDGLFAGAVGALAIAGSIAAARDEAPLDARAYALLLACTAGLVVRRRMPGVAVAVTFVATMVYIYLGYPYGPVFIFGSVAIYSAAAWRSTRFAVTAVVLLLLAHVPWSLWGETDPDTPLFVSVVTTLWLASPLAVGIAVRLQRQAHARTLAEDRNRHIYEERLRIAQEVHDVVGHSLAVISMNAGAGLHVLSKQPGPPQVTESLRAIRQASSGALDELRATLTGIGRGPGLDSVPALVAATNVNALHATLVVTGQRRDVAPEVDLAGYRIVQESLANVVRHASAQHARVDVDYDPDRVVVTVTDDGRGGPVRPGGSGLRSMADRARSLGGTLAAAPGPAGGFVVRAELPYRKVRT